MMWPNETQSMKEEHMSDKELLQCLHSMLAAISETQQGLILMNTCHQQERQALEARVSQLEAKLNTPGGEVN